MWEALTTGEGIARWFGPYAAVTPGEGGSVSVVEREGMKETHGMGIWLSLYGLPEATAAPLRQALQT